MAVRPHLPPDAQLTLALAIVASSTAPLILLDSELKVVAASTSFFQAFQIEAAAGPGRLLSELGAGEWDVPQLGVLLQATAAGIVQVDAYEMDLKRDRVAPRRLVVNVRKLDYDDASHIRLLVSVADVTDVRIAAKLKDDLLREKAILLQEIQHRVANSLQIIASVILQSARKVTSEEIRSHLTDAHNRVMSVATLQQQLAASRLGDVELRLYFQQLCASIGASMIRDHNQLTLTVEADESAVKADVSVSMGLVVTELVINALKHAFPGGREGSIVVGYQARGANWTLSVTDDGVGMPPDAASATPGLGTSIVSALAEQLRSTVRVGNARPGTVVSLTHASSTAVDAEAEALLRDLP